MKLHLFALAIAFAAPSQGCASTQGNSQTKEVELPIGRGHPTADALHLRPTKEISSPTGYFVPKNMQQAVAELEKMLPSDQLKNVQNASGVDSDFLRRNTDLLNLATWLHQNWRLDRQDSQLGNELRAQDFETVEWMGRALLQGVFDAHRPPSKEMQRLRRIAFLEQQDERLPLTPPPSDCVVDGGVNDGFVRTHDRWIGAKNRPDGRTIYWVDCLDGTKRAYLWELEWFVPEAD